MEQLKADDRTARCGVLLRDWLQRWLENELLGSVKESSYQTDAALNIAPGLEEKKKILENAVRVAHALGNPLPIVACLCATEKVNLNAGCCQTGESKPTWKTAGLRCDIYNFILCVLYSNCYSPSECLPFAIIKMRFGNCTTKAKGVSLSFSPFKLICIPHLAQGFRHTKSGAGQPPRAASSISCRLASSSCPCPALPCLWPVSRQ